MLQVTLSLDEKQAKELFKQAILEMLIERNEVLLEVLGELIKESVLNYEEAWAASGLRSFQSDWDNSDDAVYDNWQKAYRVAAG